MMAYLCPEKRPTKSVSRWIVFEVSLAFMIGVTGNPGTEFVLTFPQSSVEVPGALMLIAMGVGTGNEIQVTIEMEAPQETTTMTLTQADPSVEVTVEETRCMPTGTTRGQEYVARISADDEVVVEVRNEGRSNVDQYLAVPTSLLGTRYYAVSYPPTGQLDSSFLVVASTTSPTNVRITLPESFLLQADRFVEYNGVIFAGGDTIELSLLSLEAFQLQSAWDLTGCRVDSDLPVAMWTGLNRTALKDNPESHLIAQTPHVGMAGRSFVFLPAPIDAPTVELRVVAIESCALVTVHDYNGGTEVYQMAMAGSFFGKTLNWTLDKSLYLESTKDIQVYRIASSSMPFGGEVLGGNALVNMSPLDKTLASEYVFTYYGKDVNNHIYYNVSVVTPWAALGGVTLNGVTLQGNPLIQNLANYDVPGRPDLAVTVMTLVEVQQGVKRYVLRQTSGTGLTGAVDVIRKYDGESHTLGYPPVSGSLQIGMSDSSNITQDVCIDVDQNGEAVFMHTDMSFHTLFHTANVRCIFDDQLIPCERKHQSYSCRAEHYYKMASATLLQTASSVLRCFRSCLSSSECVGANYDVDNGLGANNCQLLIGHKLGNSQQHSSLKHIECSATFSFDLNIP